MSTAPATPAPTPAKKASLWSKVKKVLSVVNSLTENATLKILPTLKQIAPPIANMATNILNADIHMCAAVGSAEASAPAGASKAQRGLLVAGAIENQLLQDAASFGKNVSGIIPELIGYQQNFLAAIASAPDLEMAPSLAQVDAAEAAAGLPTA